MFYRWGTSRAAACLDNIIPVNLTGKIQCDGYSAYRAFGMFPMPKIKRFAASNNACLKENPGRRSGWCWFGAHR